jgi:hypothetical protein
VHDNTAPCPVKPVPRPAPHPATRRCAAARLALGGDGGRHGAVGELRGALGAGATAGLPTGVGFSNPGAHRPGRSCRGSRARADSNARLTSAAADELRDCSSGRNGALSTPIPCSPVRVPPSATTSRKAPRWPGGPAGPRPVVPRKLTWKLPSPAP